ncbi:hypothetical protein RND81_14G185000 [Saponaria officinalis]|uniref:Exocyst component Exo84 C-terminal domain-containing protein n=1 Tax=Saponaria officinalis TaxID=3572 RepID=A0AAW1GNG8_SAPOF
MIFKFLFICIQYIMILLYLNFVIYLTAYKTASEQNIERDREGSMESSEEDEDFSYHEGIIPQSKINSLFQSHTEKGIRKLCCELLDLKDSVENLCGNTRAKYLAFLRLSEEVVEMDHEFVELRKHISAQGILIQDLVNGVFRELEECIKAEDHEDESESQLADLEDLSSIDSEDKNRIFLEKIDILVAECKFQEAMEALELEERSSSELRSGTDASLDASSYKSAFLKRKANLESQLVKFAEQPSLGDAELKQALHGLLKLGKGPLGHHILLKRYTSRLRKRVEAFIPSCSRFPCTYPLTLSKIVFSYISMAAKESHSTFGDDPIYRNKVVQLAEEELESFVRVVKENGQSSDTVSALHAASVCVQASLNNCVSLEDQGLKLSKLLIVLLQPYMEEVLEMNFRRCRRSLVDLAQNDDIPMSPQFVTPLSVFTLSSGTALMSSGVKFLFIVKVSGFSF